MINTRHQMANALKDVDPMVVTLKRDVCATLGAATTARFEICLSEALTNIAKHAAPANPDALIDVVVTETADTVSVAVFDPDGAAPFDLRDHASDLGSIDPMAESGRGLGLIMQCADAIDYGPLDGRNCLVLTFKKAIK